MDSWQIVGSLTATHVAAFVVGYYSKVWADKTTDHRRQREERQKRDKMIADAIQNAASLVAAIRAEVRKPENAHIIDFAFEVAKAGGRRKDRLNFDPDTDPAWKRQIHILETAGLIADVREGILPVYRMSEAFLDLLRA